MGFNMIEKIVNRDGKQVTEIRSDAGKLLFIKTLQGYEIKCPRTKQVYVVKYEDMLLDCMANKKQRTDDLESRSLIITRTERGLR